MNTPSRWAATSSHPTPPSSRLPTLSSLSPLAFPRPPSARGRRDTVRTASDRRNFRGSPAQLGDRLPPTRSSNQLSLKKGDTPGSLSLRAVCRQHAIPGHTTPHSMTALKTSPRAFVPARCATPALCGLRAALASPVRRVLELSPQRCILQVHGYVYGLDMGLDFIPSPPSPSACGPLFAVPPPPCAPVCASRVATEIFLGSSASLASVTPPAANHLVPAPCELLDAQLAPPNKCSSPPGLAIWTLVTRSCALAAPPVPRAPARRPYTRYGCPYASNFLLADAQGTQLVDSCLVLPRRRCSMHGLRAPLPELRRAGVPPRVADSAVSVDEFVVESSALPRGALVQLMMGRRPGRRSGGSLPEAHKSVLAELHGGGCTARGSAH
ncbi:hypothetical protein FB451DRAFT_1565649 [Mycena latifolia]|nr:hypothetical protein FB451DRAFT_1565649 [Mycena latifolia]